MHFFIRVILFYVFCTFPVLANELVDFNIDGFRVGDPLKKSFADKFCMEEIYESKEIECRQRKNINSIPVKVSYLFYENSLVSMSLQFPTEHYDDIVKSFAKSLFRQPHERTSETITLVDGSEFMNRRSIWHTRTGDFIIEKYGTNLSEGYAQLDSIKYQQYVEKKKAQANDGSIRRLFIEFFE